MKKVILLSIVSAIVMFCCMCAGMESFFTGQHIKEGVAQPGSTHSPYVEITDVETFNRCSALCYEECDKRGVSRAGMVVRLDAERRRCFCENIRRNLSHVVNVGSTNSENECSVKAWDAGYLRYFYDSGTGKCGGEQSYTSLGLAETKDDCFAISKAKGYPKARTAYKSDTKRCYYVPWEPGSL